MLDHTLSHVEQRLFGESELEAEIVFRLVDVHLVSHVLRGHVAVRLPGDVGELRQILDGKHVSQLDERVRMAGRHQILMMALQSRGARIQNRYNTQEK